VCGYRYEYMITCSSNSFYVILLLLDITRVNGFVCNFGRLGVTL
jgi:hypothetical protein